MQDLYDIYGTWHIPFWQTTTFYVVVSLLVGLVVLWIAWYFINNYRAKKQQRTPWERALHSLEQLRSQKVVSVQHGKQFYLALTTIIKQYLHDRFNFDVLGKTDRELLMYLEHIHVAPDLVEDIRAIAQGGLLVKFANVQAVQEQVDKDFERAVLLIKKTIPKKSK